MNSAAAVRGARWGRRALLSPVACFAAAGVLTAAAGFPGAAVQTGAAAVRTPAAPAAAPGHLDGRFGGGLPVTTAFPGRQGANANAVAVQPDGRIVVAGTTSSQADGIALVRYLADGRLDPTFGAGGRVMTALGEPASGGWSGAATGLALQRDGGIVIAAIAATPSGPALAVLRYGTDGVLDRSFGRRGVVIVSGRATGERPSDAGSAKVVATASGRILALGAFTGPIDADGFEPPPVSLVTALTSDGRPDRGFAGTGRVVLAGQYATGFAADSRGRLLVTGTAGTDRLLADGSRDRRFGRGGRVASVPGSDVIAQPGGGALVIGDGVARLAPDGSPDPSYGRRGSGLGYSFGAADGSGGVIANGGAQVRRSLLRLDRRGRLDRSFGGDGVVQLPGAFNPSAVAVEPGGSFVVAGTGGSAAGWRPVFTVMRFLGAAEAARRSADAPCASSGRTVTCAFTTPGAQLWRVPAGVRMARIEVWGAQGGAGGGSAVPGGSGGLLAARLPVRPGAVLAVTVGGRGTEGRPGAQTGDPDPYGRPPPPGPTAAGGYGGGAPGGAGPFAGGGGGGASWIGTGPDRADILLVAGGGGGGAPLGPGGAGSGADGLPAPGGGFGGYVDIAGRDGPGVEAALVPPHANPSVFFDMRNGTRAGSGGGYYGYTGGGGGGGGAAGGGGGGGSTLQLWNAMALGSGPFVAVPGAGGGGGSGWADPAATEVRALPGVRPGDGLVVIRYELGR